MCYNYDEFSPDCLRRAEIAVRTKVKKRVVRETLAAKSESLRRYEMVVIVRPEASDDEVEAVLEGIKSIITAKSGPVEEVTMWGKRKLAYPISHATEGFYALLHFIAGPTTNKEINDNLRISEKVLRHMIVLAEC